MIHETQNDEEKKFAYLEAYDDVWAAFFGFNMWTNFFSFDGTFSQTFSSSSPFCASAKTQIVNTKKKQESSNYRPA
jgi:hypothetical protein